MGILSQERREKRSCTRRFNLIAIGEGGPNMLDMWNAGGCRDKGNQAKGVPVDGDGCPFFSARLRAPTGDAGPLDIIFLA
jgi:hypothetical protein